MADSVRIFIGTDPNMGKAELALEYSIYSSTDHDVEIVWMDHSQGGVWEGWNIGREYGLPYAKKGWATDFTNFRWAIPEVCNFEGRAIYIDVDMLVLKDIYGLFSLPLPRPILISSHGFDVALFDCAAFKEFDFWPSIEEMKKSDWNWQDYAKLLKKNKAVSTDLSMQWDCLDGRGYDPDLTCLVHYTNMNTQPWKPHPKVFDYPPHPRQDMTDLFWKYYEEGKQAKEEGKYTFTHPNPI